MNKKSLILLVALFLNWTGYGQDENSELFKTIKEKDSLLYTIWCNNGNIFQFESLINANFEYSNDQSEITLSKSEFINAVKNGRHVMLNKSKRILDETSLEITPVMKDGVLYGAIQKGTHHSYAIESNGSEHLISTAKFNHLWLLENGIWTLSRVFSYDHEVVETYDTEGQ